MNCDINYWIEPAVNAGPKYQIYLLNLTFIVRFEDWDVYIL